MRMMVFVLMIFVHHEDDGARVDCFSHHEDGDGDDDDFCHILRYLLGWFCHNI